MFCSLALLFFRSLNQHLYFLPKNIFAYRANCQKMPITSNLSTACLVRNWRDKRRVLSRCRAVSSSHQLAAPPKPMWISKEVTFGKDWRNVSWLNLIIVLLVIKLCFDNSLMVLESIFSNTYCKSGYSHMYCFIFV